MIAVDPHKASNTAAVLDPVSKTVIESARFANSADGYGELAGFAARWEHRRWAVEGCHGAGRSLAQRLVADGEPWSPRPAPAYEAVCAGVRLRWAVWARARLSWARQVIADTAPWACHSGCAHDNQTCMQSRGLPPAPAEAGRGTQLDIPIRARPGLRSQHRGAGSSDQGLRHRRRGLRHWLTG